MGYHKQRNFFIAIYTIGFFTYSMGATQYIPYLTSIGYDAIQRGILLSSLAVTTIVFQLVLGFLSDKFRTIKKFLLFLAIGFAICAFFFYNVQEKIFVFHLISIALCGGIASSSYGIYDNWVLESGDKLRSIFSTLRAFGSVGWGLGCTLVAAIINVAGYRGVAVAILFFTVITVAFMALIPDARKSQDQSAPKLSVRDLKELIYNRKYMLLVFIMFLGCCIGQALGTTQVDKLILLKATTMQVGYVWALRALIEVPTLFLGAKLLRKFNTYSLLCVTSLVYGLQFVGFAFCQTVASMIALNALQMFTNPLFMIATKTIIFRFASDKLKSSAQLFAAAFSGGLSTLVIPILSGYLTQLFNVDVMMFLMAATGAVMFVLVCLLRLIEQREFRREECQQVISQ